ncbi:MAG TPA: ABC transporter substrate-binding protein [Stellaceae bacterium]|nr:ABC transporter substrate-binding protein [Stellaceae bacterium]
MMLWSAAARTAEPLDIRIAWAAVPGQLPAVLYQNHSILKHYGQSYTVDAVYNRGSGTQITALAAGELQVVLYAPSALALTIENAHMDDIRIIGDATRDGYDDYFSRQYMVRADSPIHGIEDLKGKVLAINSITGAMDMALRAALRQHGMEDKRDVRIVEIDFPHMFAELTSGKVDLGSFTTPWSFEAKKSGQTRTLFTMKDLVGEQDITIMAARAPFIAQNRAALVDFFEDSQRAMRWFYDPANRDAVLNIISTFTKQPKSLYADWLFTKRDDYRDPDLRPNLDAVQRDIDREADMGFLKSRFDVGKYADLSLVDEAAKRLAAH